MQIECQKRNVKTHRNVACVNALLRSINAVQSFNQAKPIIIKHLQW
jgi:hypothetical protein